MTKRHVAFRFADYLQIRLALLANNPTMVSVCKQSKSCKSFRKLSCPIESSNSKLWRQWCIGAFQTKLLPLPLYTPRFLPSHSHRSLSPQNYFPIYLLISLPCPYLHSNTYKYRNHLMQDSIDPHADRCTRASFHTRWRSRTSGNEQSTKSPDTSE